MWRTLHITSCGTLWDNNVPTDHFKDTRARQQTAHELKDFEPPWWESHCVSEYKLCKQNETMRLPVNGF